METKEEIIEKLKELKIESTNAYPKKSFLFEGEPSISCFKRELQSNFYFYNAYDKKLYVLAKYEDYDTKFQTDQFNGVTKFIVPLTYCSILWEDKVFEELEDVPFKDMTLRDYACIKLKVPQSNHNWLNDLIRFSK